MNEWFNLGGPFAGNLGILGFGAFGFLVLLAWSLVWKGMALWKSAHRDEKIWFIVFLVVNTLGVLEILYLYVFTKKKQEPMQNQTSSPR